MRTAAVILALLTLASCQASYPPEIATGHAIAVRMAKANLETRLRMVEAYGESLRQAHEKQLQLIMERELAKAEDKENLPGMVPAETVTRLMGLADQQRQKLRQDLETEKRKWLGDPNAVELTRLLDALNQHSQSVDAWAREVDRLLEAVGIEPTPVTPAPSRIPQT